MDWKLITAAVRGYRTYLTAAITVLTALAAVVGVVPTERAAAIAVACLGLAQLFQRFATGEASRKLDELLDTITRDQAAAAELRIYEPGPDDPPTTVPFKPLLVLVLLAFGGTAWAAAPRAVISGPERAISGEIIELSAAQSEQEPTHYSWEISPQLRGRRQLRVSPAGVTAIVASYPGEYLITLTVSNSDGHSTAHHQLSIPGTTPPNPVPGPLPDNTPPGPAPAPPAPGPTPPGPSPPAPEPLTGIALLTHSAASAVNSPNRATEAACLAEGVKALAAAVAAGKHGSGSLALAQGCVADLGELLDRCTTAPWATARETLAERVAEAWKAGGLRTIDNWVEILGQIETGLRRVK